MFYKCLQEDQLLIYSDKKYNCRWDKLKKKIHYRSHNVGNKTMTNLLSDINVHYDYFYEIFKDVKII